MPAKKPDLRQGNQEVRGCVQQYCDRGFDMRPRNPTFEILSKLLGNRGPDIGLIQSDVVQSACAHDLVRQDFGECAISELLPSDSMRPFSLP